MHSLIFPEHIAILDPVTGMGVLVLPGQRSCDDRLSGYANDITGLAGAQAFSSLNYAALMTQLARVGWELPTDDEGCPAWRAAGRTDCCGRIMISLSGLDPTDPHPGRSTLAEAVRQQRNLAASACCGTSPAHQVAQQPTAGWVQPSEARANTR